MSYPYYPEQPQPGPPGPPPENYLVWAILVTLLCCQPLGVVSIIKANQVNTFWVQGMYTEAYKSAEEAKNFAMWGAIAVLIPIVLYVGFIFLMMGSIVSGF